MDLGSFNLTATGLIMLEIGKGLTNLDDNFPRSQGLEWTAKLVPPGKQVPWYNVCPLPFYTEQRSRPDDPS